MAAVTFTSGYIPNFGTSKKTLNIIAVFGGGVLMGAAILIVLPEACKVMVENNFESSKVTKIEEVFPSFLV